MDNGEKNVQITLLRESFSITHGQWRKKCANHFHCGNHFQSPMDNGEKNVQITFDHPWTTQSTEYINVA
jgi:hypothetical protein